MESKDDLQENPPELVTLTVRVSRSTADRLKAKASRAYRPVAAHMRLLIEQDIADDDQLSTVEEKAA